MTMFANVYTSRLTPVGLWTLFSLFVSCREFYYIQMEKYARQALSEGIKTPEDIHVTMESELYRVINLHYNRNNHIEVRICTVELSLGVSLLLL